MIKRVTEKSSHPLFSFVKWRFRKGKGLDISAIENGYQAGGTSICHQGMMLKVITYAYLDNVY